MLGFVFAGTFYIEGIFYTRLNDYDYVYRLLEDELVVYMYSHLVRCINVLISQYNSCWDLYTISVDVYVQMYLQHYAMEFVAIVISYQFSCEGV